MQYIKNNKRKGVSLLILALGIVALMGFASFVADLGMIMNARNELQKVVESVALVGASNLEPQQDIAGNVTIDTSQVVTVMTDTYNQMVASNPMLANASAPTITFNAQSKAVRIFTTLDVGTYFAKIIGINAVRVQAQAAALSSPYYLNATFPKGFSPGSIIRETSGDSDIRKPVGDNENVNMLFDRALSAPDNKALTLGPGGYLTMRFTMPLMDGIGADLYIREIGNLEGYYLFAGNDADPDNPYVNEVMTGSGINWVNISCTGIPVDIDPTGSPIGSYLANVNYSSGTTKEAKFYGSGIFDIGKTCTDSTGNILYDGNVKGVKYLKIIDDNTIDGFLREDITKPVVLIGENSSITAGVDIDAVAILHHTRLISTIEFNKDTDNDNLIDLLETIIGTNPSAADSDADGINDSLEYSGWYGASQSIIDAGSQQAQFTNPLDAETDGPGIIYIDNPS